MSVYVKMELCGSSMNYARGFVDGLLKESVPSVFLGDIPESRRKLYFDISNLDKDKYFKLGIGQDIIKELSSKYHHEDEKEDFLTEGNWTEGNGILFYCTKNMIIVLDYKEDSENQCLLVERV